MTDLGLEAKRRSGLPIVRLAQVGTRQLLTVSGATPGFTDTSQG